MFVNGKHLDVPYNYKWMKFAYSAYVTNCPLLLPSEFSMSPVIFDVLIIEIISTL